MAERIGASALDRGLSNDPHAMGTEGAELLIYGRIAWARRRLIAAVMLAAALISAGGSLLMPNIYRAQLMMAPVSDGKAAGDAGGLASTLGGLGGLSSLVGIPLGNTNSAAQNLAVLRSRQFLWGFIKDNKLLPVLFPKAHVTGSQDDYWGAYREFSGLISVDRNRITGLVTLSVDWRDAGQAAEWANALVARLNTYLRRQAIASSESNLRYLHQALDKATVSGVRQALFALILQEQKKAMLANTQKEFAFRIIDPAVAPDIKVRPRRSLIVMVATSVAGLLAVMFVIVRAWVSDEH